MTPYLAFVVALGIGLMAPAAVPAQSAAPATAAPTSPAPPQAEAPLTLLMVERPGCIYCEAWRREILPGYALTPEGRAAPVRHVQIDGPWPDGIALARRPYITPTFILLQSGKEVGRLEGYPGEDFFWPLLDKLIADARAVTSIRHKGG